MGKALGPLALQVFSSECEQLLYRLVLAEEPHVVLELIHHDCIAPRRDLLLASHIVLTSSILKYTVYEFCTVIIMKTFVKFTPLHLLSLLMYVGTLLIWIQSNPKV